MSRRKKLVRDWYVLGMFAICCALAALAWIFTDLLLLWLVPAGAALGWFYASVRNEVLLRRNKRN